RRSGLLDQLQVRRPYTGCEPPEERPQAVGVGEAAVGHRSVGETAQGQLTGGQDGGVAGTGGDGAVGSGDLDEHRAVAVVGPVDGAVGQHHVLVVGDVVDVVLDVLLAAAHAEPAAVGVPHRVAEAEHR